jgi:hypothetical protein
MQALVGETVDYDAAPPFPEAASFASYRSLTFHVCHFFPFSLVNLFKQVTQSHWTSSGNFGPLWW